MAASIALAQIFALYFTVIGLSLIINRRFFRAMLKDLVHSHIAMLIIATVTLILGAVLVVVHNVWTSDWRVAVTLVCWLTFVAGVVRTLFPGFIQQMAARVLLRDWVLMTAGVSCVVVGAGFAWVGWF